MSKPTATTFHLSSSSDNEDSSPLTNSEKGVATTSEPTAIKKASVAESESPDSESVATKKAKTRKKAAVSKPAKRVSIATTSKPPESKKAAAVNADPEKSVPTMKNSKTATPSKRVASVSPDDPSPKKARSSSLFQRLWTEEDEVTVLEEMVNYQALNGVYALSDTKKFHAFLEGKLISDFDRNQVAGKVRKLKKKYENSAGKKTLTPYEEKLRKICKVIWGENSEIKAAGVEKEQLDAAAEEEEEDDNETKTKKEWKFIGKKSIAMGLNEHTVKEGMEVCSDDVKEEIEEEWKQLFVEEADLFLKQLKLVIKEDTQILGRS